MLGFTPVLVTAFVQVNTIRGNRYLDDAGKIMNAWEDYFPTIQVGLDGLKMNNPTAVMRDLQVDTKRIWIHYEEPESIEMIAKQSRQVIDSVSKTIGVDSFSRVAIRIQYVVATKDNPNFVYETYKTIFGSTVTKLLETNSQEDKHSFELNLPLKSDRLLINQRIYPVQKTAEGDSKDLPPDGIMFDSDIHIPTLVRLQGLGSFFREAEQWTRETLLSIISRPLC